MQRRCRRECVVYTARRLNDKNANIGSLPRRHEAFQNMEQIISRKKAPEDR